MKNNNWLKTLSKLSLYHAALIFGIVGCSTGSFVNFITTDKDRLMDGDKELRFISFNTPNLHYIEDYLAFDAANPWRLPDEFEIRDALTTIKELGGKVTRMYVLSVRKAGESKKIIRHVEAPGVFNEEAFCALDKVMQVANEVGVRVIVPLVDNWWWWGGPVEYAAFRNKNKEEFWTDSQLISDFKKTVEFIVNRRNTFTGVPYKEDKALLGWETGNELVCPYSWTAEIASYIKSLDKNHIVIEGTHAQTLSEQAISDPNIDVLSTHHYSKVDESIKNILKNKEISRDKKPYFVGEFGLTAPENIKAIVDTALSNNVSGIMIWSLRFHDRDGGFYLHRENNGNGPFRFPGFQSGDVYNEKEIINFMRTRAFEVDGVNAPPLNIPEPPKLLAFDDVYDISWQGSVGAESYVLQRRETSQKDWMIISDNVIDADAAYKPIFADTTVEIGQHYFYRVLAKNEIGISEPSNEIGPVKVNFHRNVDELEDLSKIYSKDGIVEQIKFKEIYQVKEDDSRFAVNSGSSVIYEVSESITSFKIFAFARKSACGITLLASDSLNNFTELTASLESFPPFKNVYGFLIPITLTCEEFPINTKYVKILFNEESQLGRTEIEYSLKSIK
jgi:mannan endo-1,4-beta-mannosidase